MQQYTSSLSPKGQITIPLEVRRKLGLKPKDRVAICVEGERITLAPARSAIERMYQSVPALEPPRSWREITEIAAEEMAEDAAREGLRRD